MLNVMHAVILRDIRSRYFNNGLGFLVAPLFPVFHLLVLLTIYFITNRSAVFGDDMQLFFATGILPALTINYVSRFMSYSVISNKSMMSFPAVFLLDILLARSALELLSIVFSTVIIIVILLTMGSNIVPIDIGQAMACMAVVAYFSIGVGIVIGVLTALAPLVSLAYVLFTVVLYIGSGAPIYLEGYPAEALYWISYNPLYQAVTWMRSAYYLGYPTQYLDKTYFVGCAVVSLALGLLMERMLRKIILNGG